MRFTLAQIRKLQMPYRFEEELDLSEDLDGFEDIISVQPCKVTAEIKERGVDTYLFQFHISMDLEMECAITLQGVPYHIETSADEIFTVDDSIEDAFLIEGQTIDTKEAILTNVLIAKPMTIVAEGVDFESDEEPEIEQKAESVNPAFASLKDLL